MFQAYRIGEDMKKNIVRVMVLGVLIMLCIWQTTTLWLGDMSGHNFFSSNVNAYEISYTHPKETWININGSNIYKLENTSEKEEMFGELVLELQKENLHIDLSPKELYAQLLRSTKGVVYEFGTNLSIDEIIGQELRVRHKKYVSKKIKEIYVDLSEVEAYKAYVYLINDEAKVVQKVTLDSQLKSEAGVLNIYSAPEDVNGEPVYQASILSANDSSFFKGNTFYPRDIPITATLFKFEPVISNIEENELENYVNALFKNPSYKVRNIIDGGVAFSDNLNVSVKYNMTGTLEFNNTLINDQEKISDIERLRRVNTFIKDSQAIPSLLKKGLYLEEIKTDEKTGEIYYRYGYRYNNIEVVLSNQIKQKLGVTSFLELRVKNSEIAGGKWIMYQPLSVEAQAQMNSGNIDAIEMIYERNNSAKDGIFLLDGLECAYVVEDIDRNVNFQWVGLYKHQYI